MTAPVDVDLAKAAAQAAVEAWNEKIKPGDPVLYWPGNRRSRHARIDVIARPASVYGDPPRGLVLLRGLWKDVPIGHVRLHRLADQVRALGSVEDRELEFPPPNCAFCGLVPCDNDDGIWFCPECAARWPEYGHLGGAVRRCVECFDTYAAVVGADRQPRCTLCQVEVLSGELDPTEPYPCRRCKAEVVGMSRGSEASHRGMCGDCNHRRKVDERLYRPLPLVDRPMSSGNAPRLVERATTGEEFL